MFNLSGYKPEKVVDTDGMIKGKATCQVNSSLITNVSGEGFEPYERLKYELEVMDGAYAGRRVWKSYNLDSQLRSGKAEKTPSEKLADVMWTLGLEFISPTKEETKERLVVANEKFVNMKLAVSFKHIPADRARDGEDVQLHSILGEAKVGAVAGSGKSAF